MPEKQGCRRALGSVPSYILIPLLGVAIVVALPITVAEAVLDKYPKLRPRKPFKRPRRCRYCKKWTRHYEMLLPGVMFHGCPSGYWRGTTLDGTRTGGMVVQENSSGSEETLTASFDALAASQTYATFTNVASGIAVAFLLFLLPRALTTRQNPFSTFEHSSKQSNPASSHSMPQRQVCTYPFGAVPKYIFYPVFGVAFVVAIPVVVVGTVVEKVAEGYRKVRSKEQSQPKAGKCHRCKKYKPDHKGLLGREICQDCQSGLPVDIHAGPEVRGGSEAQMMDKALGSEETLTATFDGKSVDSVSTENL